jgi:hypothetical protein
MLPMQEMAGLSVMEELSYYKDDWNIKYNNKLSKNK